MNMSCPLEHEINPRTSLLVPSVLKFELSGARGPVANQSPDPSLTFNSNCAVCIKQGLRNVFISSQTDPLIEPNYEVGGTTFLTVVSKCEHEIASCLRSKCKQNVGSAGQIGRHREASTCVMHGQIFALPYLLPYLSPTRPGRNTIINIPVASPSV